MDTYNIRHLVGIKASPNTVYQALTDTKKLAGWWTVDTRGEGSTVGSVLEFWFGDFCLKFEVADLQQGKLVRWKYDGKDVEWAGTEVAFSLSADEEQCYVHFSHTGWLSDSGCFSHCSTKWAVFMLSLKAIIRKKAKGNRRPTT